MLGRLGEAADTAFAASPSPHSDDWISWRHPHLLGELGAIGPSDIGLNEQIFGAIEQVPGRDQTYITDISPEGDLGEAKNKHLLPTPQSEEAEFDPLC